MIGSGATATARIIPDNTQSDSYRLQLSREVRRYADCITVHDLPGIFHYWSNRYLRPRLLPFGFSNPDEMFARYLAEHSDGSCARPRRFVSLGSGNCDLEASLALGLRAQGIPFVFDCVDLNPAMLERAKIQAAALGIGDCMSFICADLNTWNPDAEYDAAIANQSLHHVVNLEHLIGGIGRALRPGGRFLISDMIGRNGHQRWPEALDIVHEFWRSLPPSYRFNHKSGRYEDLYLDHDCSGEGFEGVRSQDILPVLLESFEFRVFIPFGNVIDPFVDRAFGPNFDPEIPWDREFIDAVHARDEEELLAGRITPTHMLAVAETRSGFSGGARPESCVRREGPAARHVPEIRTAVSALPFGPHGLEWELENACRHLTDCSGKIARLEALVELHASAHATLTDEFERRTEWARGLDEQLHARTAWARGLEEQVLARTEWALATERELEEKTDWNLRLREELDRQSRRAIELEREIAGYVRNPFRLVRRILRALIGEAGFGRLGVRTALKRQRP